MIINPLINVDLNFITHRMATGGEISNLDHLQELKSLGITHIVNARSEFNDAVLFTKNLNFHYLWNGVDDDGGPKPIVWFKRAIDFALTALAVSDTKIYIHCAAGVNRGPSLAYAVLRAQGIPGDLSFSLIKQKRSVAYIAYSIDADMAVKELGYE